MFLFKKYIVHLSTRIKNVEIIKVRKKDEIVKDQNVFKCLLVEIFNLIIKF